MDSVFIMDQKLPFLALLLLSFFCIIEGLNSSATKIGAILDLDSRMGKEQKMAMQIAVENFNNANTSIHFVYYNQNTSLQTALAGSFLPPLYNTHTHIYIFFNLVICKDFHRLIQDFIFCEVLSLLSSYLYGFTLSTECYGRNALKSSVVASEYLFSH